VNLPKFIFGMLLVAFAVVIWSAFSGYTPGDVVIRFVLCVVGLQIGYFAYVVVLVGRRGDELQSRHRRKAGSEVAPLDGHNIPNH